MFNFTVTEMISRELASLLAHQQAVGFPQAGAGNEKATAKIYTFFAMCLSLK